MKPNNHIQLFFIILVAASLACSINVGGPEYPAQTVPASATDAQTLRDMIQQAMVTGAETGVITLQITESQLTGYIAEKIALQTTPPFTEPQILLRNGQMMMYGKFTQGWFTGNMLITMNVTIDEATGQPKIQIASADFGPVPAPEGLNTAISAIIDEAFTGSFGPVAVGFRLQTISIADGIMTVTGRIK
ncbi:MAG: hypothetical protein IPG80_16375 [Anaerolineales bacterium]|uniref:hypothetical protein n=1 Tax=Candidatus Villigracilis vicinus TaxID=3140679 RepID=UPI0031351DC4|nr:hypothetical protein [Anaerolineales bacterium]MBK9781569.1 hypothetical protein [Anaerolineales bacterium]